MTKPVTRKMAVDCLLSRIGQSQLVEDGMGGWMRVLVCRVCNKPMFAEQDIQFDHVHADKLGGSHHYLNLRPIHADCHKKKTKADVQALAKIDRITGVTKGPKKRKWPKRKMRSRSSWPKRA